LIWEKGNSDNPNWLHIGWRKQSQQEIMTYENGVYKDYFKSNYYTIHKAKHLIG